MKAFRDGEVVREFVGALPPAAVAEFLDELTGPRATERVAAELRATGELPEVVAALEQDEHERALELLLEAIAAADGRAPRAAHQPRGRPVRRPRPRASADDALPAAAGRHPLLMATSASTHGNRAAEGVPLPALGRVDRRAARRRPRRGQAADRDHAAARLPRHRSVDLEPRGLLRRRGGLVSGRDLHRARRPRRARVHEPARSTATGSPARAPTAASASRGCCSGSRSRPIPPTRQEAESLAEQAEGTCLVSASLDLPVER